MIENLKNLNPVIQALIATSFTYFLTGVGSLFVFLPFKPSQRLKDGMLGFAAGVMIAASFWSLLAPAIRLSEEMGFSKWFPSATGFLIGAFFIWGIDRILPHLHLGLKIQKAEGIKSNFAKTTLLILAITLHNIPEGLAVGVAFGASIKKSIISINFASAWALAFGIGLQNFPEGIAVAMPLRAEGFSKFKSFFYGQLSGIVEPIFGILGALFVMKFAPLLPYALAFAAGAMIFVVVEEVIPESQYAGNTDIATLSTLLGFITMMVLDTALS